MAATYGYGGEFSSDEDIDKMERQSERMTQSKFEASAQSRPTKQQIEEAIETIRLLPAEQDVSLTDELLAGLLDHYKTQRGPIVDSTRNLYRKIVLRLIRGEQLAKNTNGEPAKGSNGNLNNNDTNIAGNKQRLITAELASSDEDEPMPPVSSQSSVEQEARRKFEGHILYNDKLEPMDVDSEIVEVEDRIRTRKPAESSDTEESDEDKTDSEDSDSEVLDVTPVKPRTVQASAVSAPKSSTPIASKLDSVRKNTLVSKESSSTDTKKKPYTRSQRVAATRASSATAKPIDVSSSKVEGIASNRTLQRSSLTSKFTAKYIIFALVVAIFASILYYFKSDLTKTTDRILSRAINFK